MKKQSREKVIEKATKVMQKSGAENFVKARFAHDIGKVVQNSNKTLFCQIKPHVKNIQTKAWKEAFSMVFSYLEETNRKLVLSAIDYELKGLYSEQKQQTPNITFRQAIAITRRRPDSLEEKAEDFMELTNKINSSVAATSLEIPPKKTTVEQQTTINVKPSELPKSAEQNTHTGFSDDDEDFSFDVDFNPNAEQTPGLFDQNNKTNDDPFASDSDDIFGSSFD